MEYSTDQPQQGYDPSSQSQQYYNQFAEGYNSYGYPNPQYASNQPYPYHAVNVQPSEYVQAQQEPTPPGVAVQPPSQQYPSAYYQSLDYGAADYAAAAAAGYAFGAQHGGVDPSVSLAHQQIVQPSYIDPSTISNTVPPPEVSQASASHIPNIRSGARPYRGRGSGRGWGRGRGRGRGQKPHKRGPAPAQDQMTFALGQAHVQPGPPQHLPQPYPPVPFPGQPHHSGPILPGSRHLFCELCKVECNSLEILNLHLSGKKHMKKLKIFQESQNLNSLTVGRQIEQMYVLPEVPSQTNQILASTDQQPQQESLPSQSINQEKVVEVKKPFWCELCKADCNSLEIFNKHLNGKKHQKNLKSSRRLHIGVAQMEPASQIQPPENQLPSQDDCQENKTDANNPKNQEPATVTETGKNATAHVSGNLRGTKRKMRGGKIGQIMKRRPAEPPRPKEIIPLICELCNVKCESQVGFQSHLAGKKHLSNAKRFLSENKTLGQEVFQILRHAVQTLHEQNAMASIPVASQLNSQGFLVQPINFQASSLLENTNLEGTSGQQLLPANFGGPIVASVEGVPDKGRTEGKMETVANDSNTTNVG